MWTESMRERSPRADGSCAYVWHTTGSPVLSPSVNSEFSAVCELFSVRQQSWWPSLCPQLAPLAWHPLWTTRRWATSSCPSWRSRTPWRISWIWKCCQKRYCGAPVCSDCHDFGEESGLWGLWLGIVELLCVQTALNSEKVGLRRVGFGDCDWGVRFDTWLWLGWFD